jgi:hypothetical protein
MDNDKAERRRLYNIWCAMKGRCLNPADQSYLNYGGRGITVCKRWLNFDNFLTDMGMPSDRKLCLERMDNDKGYSPKNCKWATRKEQQNNTRRNRIVDGLTISQITDKTDLTYSTAYRRITKGLPLDAPLNSFPGWRSRQVNCVNGHSLSGDNLYLTPDGRRQCKACNRSRGQKYSTRKKVNLANSI